MNTFMNTEKARFNMIEQQIRPWNVLDADVLALLSEIKREDFVPAGLRALAFTDTELPLKSGEDAPHMLAPRVQARIVQDVAARPDDKVLLVGAGSGYLAALLAKRAKQVIALEIDAELAALARANLQKAGISNAQVQQADGSQGAPAEAPFDVIVLAGSVAEVPAGLLAQLAVGGRLFAIVGEPNAPMMRATLITRVQDQSYQSHPSWDTVAPRLRNFPEAARFHF
jgi:protein-L-isoaspartate(D-aspartate) O-methyltransferase